MCVPVSTSWIRYFLRLTGLLDRQGIEQTDAFVWKHFLLWRSLLLKTLVSGFWNYADGIEKSFYVLRVVTACFGFSSAQLDLSLPTNHPSLTSRMVSTQNPLLYPNDQILCVVFGAVEKCQTKMSMWNGRLCLRQIEIQPSFTAIGS